MSSALHNKVVVVSGASAGVGRAVVRELANQGARIALLARGRAGLDGARADALRLGSPAAITIPTDIADADAVDRAAARTEEELGPIDVWINVAMVSVFAPVTEIKPAEYKRVTEVNYLGFVYGTKAALDRMLPRDRGTIVQVGSALAYRGIPLQSAYCASKHALDGFHESLRSELIADGSNVRVSLVHLPALNTPQFGWVRTTLPNHPQPVPPIFQPEVAARAIVWAARHAPRDMNIGATTLATRIGNALIPGLLDRYLARNGIEDQQTDQPIDPSAWEDNLDTPADDDVDRGAHGIFDEEAKSFSAQAWANTNRTVTALGGLGLLAAAAAGWRSLRR
jgi:NAD(P)-dependent dehydrogenase (short-subunit alcohol dehydrogenase family)